MSWWRRPVPGSRIVTLALGIALAAGGAVALLLLWTQPLNVDVDGNKMSCDIEFNFLVPGCSEAESDRTTYRLVAMMSIGIGLAILAMRRQPNAVPTERLDGQLVGIRLATPRDARSYRETITNAIRVTNGLTEAHVNASVAALGRQVAALEYVIQTRPGVCDRERIVGAVSAAAGHDGSVWVGGWVHDHWQRRGFGTEALRLLVDGLSGNGTDAIHAECATINTPVRSLLEAVGFAVTGTLTKRLPDGKFVDAVRYSRYADLLGE